jgi:hypothetical protein
VPRLSAVGISGLQAGEDVKAVVYWVADVLHWLTLHGVAAWWLNEGPGERVLRRAWKTTAPLPRGIAADDTRIRVIRHGRHVPESELEPCERCGCSRCGRGWD